MNGKANKSNNMPTNFPGMMPNGAFDPRLIDKQMKMMTMMGMGNKSMPNMMMPNNMQMMQNMFKPAQQQMFQQNMMAMGNFPMPNMGKQNKGKFQNNSNKPSQIELNKMAAQLQFFQNLNGGANPGQTGKFMKGKLFFHLKIRI
jgi:hypothetical protein